MSYRTERILTGVLSDDLYDLKLGLGCFLTTMANPWKEHKSIFVDKRTCSQEVYSQDSSFSSYSQDEESQLLFGNEYRFPWWAGCSSFLCKLISRSFEESPLFSLSKSALPSSKMLREESRFHNESLEPENEHFWLFNSKLACQWVQCTQDQGFLSSLFFVLWSLWHHPNESNRLFLVTVANEWMPSWSQRIRDGTRYRRKNEPSVTSLAKDISQTYPETSLSFSFFC